MNEPFTGPMLGHGVGLRPQHYAELLNNGPRGVGWFEAISEDYFTPGGRPWAVLERVRRDVPVVLHGVSMGIGNAEPTPESYLAQLETVIQRVEPAWVSDHLCWVAWGGQHLHDLLPLPYTRDVIETVVRHVNRIQERLRRRILLENVSAYLAFSQNELNECDAMNQIAQRTGCRLLVDVNNLVVCANNLGIGAEAYVDALDPRFVGQIHLAGHTRQGDLPIDSHVGPIPEVVWALYRRAVLRFGRVPTLVEWDEDVPAYDRVVAECALASRIEQEALGG